MKRLVSFALALIIFALPVLASAASATRMEGNFSIRNGITYRMTADEIMAAERAYGTDMSDAWIADARIGESVISVVDNTAPEGKSLMGGVRINRLKLLGKLSDYGSLLFLVDENGYFCEMIYQINAGDYEQFSYPGDEAREDYARLKSDLTNKYGKPIGEVASGKGSLLGAHTHSFNQAGYFGIVYTFSDCTQWLLQYDDCYCVIELFIRDGLTSTDRLLGRVGSLHLAYRLVTADELAELLDDAKQRQKDATRDI